MATIKRLFANQQEPMLPGNDTNSGLPTGIQRRGTAMGKAGTPGSVSPLPPRELTPPMQGQSGGTGIPGMNASDMAPSMGSDMGTGNAMAAGMDPNAMGGAPGQPGAAGDGGGGGGGEMDPTMLMALLKQLGIGGM